MTVADPVNFNEPIDKLGSKKSFLTDLSSRELMEHTSDQRRDRSFFSARVLNAQILQGFRNGVMAILKGEANTAKRRLMLKDLLDSIGYEPDEDKRGTIQDLSSNARLNLVLNWNVASLRGFGQWTQANAAGALDAFPAQELIRVAKRLVPREWEEIWDEAVDALGDSTTATDSRSGRLVAMKNDPIWIQISDFGIPWPPFKFNSGMGVEDVSYEEAIELGVMKAEDDPISPPNLGMNDDLQSSVADLDQDLERALASGMSDRVELVDGVLQFKNDAGTLRDNGHVVLRALEGVLTS